MFFQIKAIICLCLFALAYANSGGWSDSYRQQDNWGKYSFGYKIVDKHGAKQSREEHGDPWTQVGRYSIQDVDGRQRYVSYVADKSGFRAKIDTNEPGTGNVDAANAIYNGPDQHGYSETHVPSGNDGHHSGGHEESHHQHAEPHGHEENYGENDAHATSYEGNVQHVYHQTPQHAPTEHQIQYVQLEQPHITY